MAKTGLHKRGNCECSADGSYQDERCAWFEEGHEEGMRLATARIVAWLRRHDGTGMGGGLMPSLRRLQHDTAAEIEAGDHLAEAGEAK